MSSGSGGSAMRGSQWSAHVGIGVALLIGFGVSGCRFGYPPDPECAVASLAIDRLLDLHPIYQELDAVPPDRVFARYRAELDPDGSLLTDHERAEFAARAPAVLAEVSKGHCGALHAIDRALLARRRDLAALAADRTSAQRPSAAQSDRLAAVVDRKLAAYREWIPDLAVHWVRRYYENAYGERPGMIRASAERYARAFARTLGSESEFYSRGDLARFRRALASGSVGVGLTLSSVDGRTVVDRVLAGGAGQATGRLRPGDEIVAVADADGEVTFIRGMPLPRAVEPMRGAEGTRVTLTILRFGTPPLLEEVELVRGRVVPVVGLDFDERLRSGRRVKLAILRVPNFYGGESTSTRESRDDIDALLEEAESAGVDGVLVDLRDSSGGLLDHIVEVAGFFLGARVVTGVQGRGERRPALLAASGDRPPYRGSVAVLTNVRTASGSEVFAAALRDHGRAVIVGGGRTAGIGTLGRVETLAADAGAVKATFAWLVRPNGVAIHGHGVASDIRVGAEVFRTRPVDALEFPPEGDLRAGALPDGVLPIDDRLRRRLSEASRLRLEDGSALEDPLSEALEVLADLVVARWR